MTDQSRIDTLEPLTWQTLRQLMVALGGILIARGWTTESEWTGVIGLASVLGPILWRQATVRLRRRQATAAAKED